MLASRSLHMIGAVSKHAGRKCPTCGSLMPRPLVTEIRRNVPTLRHWVCKDCGTEWTSEAPTVETEGAEKAPDE
jgi:transposase-like protein